MMTKEQFLAGYGLTQAVPYTIYIRLLYRSSVKRDAWGNNRNNCNFPPCFLTRYWCFTILEQREKISFIQGALLGVNAAVVGILIAAFTIPFGRVQL